MFNASSDKLNNLTDNLEVKNLMGHKNINDHADHWHENATKSFTDKIPDNEETTKHLSKSHELKCMDLSGVWFGFDGHYYFLEQNEDRVSVRGMNESGTEFLDGRGQIMGWNLNLRFYLTDGTPGKATLVMGASGDQMLGSSVNEFTMEVHEVFLFRA